MSVGSIYLIRSLLIDGHKIGITQNWSRRSRQLEVGIKAVEVLVETVPHPRALELALHRRFRQKRIPQTEYFALSQAQVEEVKTLITCEAEKLKGDQADLYIVLARLLYEQESLPGDQTKNHAAEIEKLKRVLDPEYRRTAEYAEALARHRAAKAEAEKQQIAEQRELQRLEIEERRYRVAQKTVSTSFIEAFLHDYGGWSVYVLLSLFMSGILLPFIFLVGIFTHGTLSCERMLHAGECYHKAPEATVYLCAAAFLGFGYMAFVKVLGIRKEKERARTTIQLIQQSRPKTNQIQTTVAPDPWD